MATTRKPATIGEILTEEFLHPHALTQGALADAMGVARELCRNRRTVTAPTALILARAFGNTLKFWLNTQRRTDLRKTLNSPEERARIDRARPLTPNT